MPDSTNSTFCELTCYLNDIHQPSAIALELATPEGLVQSRLDFVVHAALRVAAGHENADIELLDLIQEGNIALLKAVKDWTGGRSRARNYQAFVSHRVYRALERCIASEEQQSGKLCSLEEHWDDLCEVEAPDELDLVDHMIYREHQGVMEAILGSLERKQKQVVALRFGILDGREKTYKEIGEAMGFTGSRAFQLLQAAQKRLRHPIHSRKLRDFHQDLSAWGKG
jgi:RNA polymerase sigma factor (sigma-70 family)